MALASGTRLGAYEILTLLGSGGMGEVYRARDVSLNRIVAIKVLPAASASAPERRERFDREAQAVAALNHPNIVTIYSVEQADGRFFLTMELVEGRSLADTLPKGGLPLEKVLAIAIPLADAVAAAHHKGITHRDLKPANIMIGDGEHAGRIKVLDFGLAKLADVPLAAASVSAMPTLPITGEGRIVGTVAYMSPEQAEGKPIDARSDLFSLGVILYEMATGVRPFTGDTSMSIISSILKDTPKSITELNPVLPPDLGRIVRRALAKDPERRYQTAKDLRNDLEELKAQLDSGDLMTSTIGSAAPHTGGGLVTRAQGLGVVAGIVALALGGIYALRSRSPQPSTSVSTASLQDLQITQLTTNGNADRPVVSPDGKYVAYIQNSNAGSDGSSVWIRQVATSSNAQIVPPEPGVRQWGLTITPDGNFVDFIRRVGPRPPELWRVSFIGGAPKKLLDDVWTPIGWSPDGRHMAFVRPDVPSGSSALILAEADGGSPRVLAVRRYPNSFASLIQVNRAAVRPAWSTDGRIIAVPGNLAGQVQIVFVDSATGSAQAVPAARGFVLGLDWLDATSLIVNQATEIAAPSQLWRLSYPSSVVTRLTNDLSSYVGVSVTAARDSLVTARTDRRVAVWVSDGVGGHANEVVSPVPSSAVVTVAWAGDRVLFTGSVSGHRAILSVRPDGGIPQEVVAQGGWPTATSDGRTIVFAPTDPARAGLWKVTDGGRAVQLIPLTGVWPSVTRDDRHVVYTAQVAGIQSLWLVSIDGGTPTQLTNRFVASPTLSPDGKTVAFFSADAQNQNVLMICDLSECMSPRSMSFPVSPIAMQKFTPDGLGIMYVTGTPPNLWVQPLDGTPARQFTHFTDDRTIADSAWSHDGRHLAIARTTTSNDIVLFKGLKR